jgi:hypothetical protein
MKTATQRLAEMNRADHTAMTIIKETPDQKNRHHRHQPTLTIQDAHVQQKDDANPDKFLHTVMTARS